MIIKNLPHLLYHQGLRYPETSAQLSKDLKGVFQPVSYRELSEQMLNFAGGLTSLGTKRGDRVGHIADNRQEWQVVSLGIMATGACDIPRGTDVTVKELSYILSFTECQTVSVENPFVLGKLCECLKDIPTLKNVIIIDTQNQALDKYELGEIKLYRYDQILKMGKLWRNDHPGILDQQIREDIDKDEVASIIFTSGTTGVPKGVQLTHNNFLCQLPALSEIFDFHRADRSMCILPIWHVYQRAFEFYVMYFAGTLCYSKPVTSMLIQDFAKVRPQLMPCVPRVWEGIYQAISKKIKKQSKTAWLIFKILSNASANALTLEGKIKGRHPVYKAQNYLQIGLSKLLYAPYVLLLPLRALGDKLYFKNIREVTGGQFACGISGGGGLPPFLDRFYNSIGIHVVEAYGLTETAPVVASRLRFAPVMGTIGKALPYNQVQIRDSEGHLLQPGQKGILYVKGQNVMKGYYKQPDLTAQVMDEEGWFNTGDLAMQTWNGELMIKGRQKDTIVLKSGENVEPFPIEAKLSESPYVQTAIVVGQDQNSLGALIIPAVEAIRNAAKQGNHPEEEIKVENTQKLLASKFARELIMREFERLICAKNGFKNFERVNQFEFLEKLEHPEEELTAKGSLIRFKVNQNYRHLINKMFNKEEKKRQRLSDIIQNLLD